MPPTKPKAASKARKLAAQTAGQSLGKAARAQAKTLPTRSLQMQASAVLSPLTRQEEATLEYAHTLTNPWVEEPAGVPLVLGSGTVRTNKAQLLYEVSMMANAQGFAFCSVNCDGWATTQPDPYSGLPFQYTSYQGGTQGNVGWCSQFTYAGTAGNGNNPLATPNYSDTAATLTTSGACVPIVARPLDPSVTSKTGVRLVAVGVRAFPDTPALTTSGKIMIASTSTPANTAANGALYAQTYSALTSMPQDLVSVETASLTGWPSGKTIHAVGIPSVPTAFQFLSSPAVGYTAFGLPVILVCGSSLAAYQTVTVQIAFDYEFVLTNTNLTGGANDPVYSIGAGAVSNIHANIQTGGRTGSGPLALLHGKNPLGVKAALQHIADTTPGRAPQILQLATRPMAVNTSGSGFGSLLSQAASGAWNLLKAHAPALLGLAAKGVKSLIGSFL